MTNPPRQQPQGQESLAYWRGLKEQAASGELRLDPDVADALWNRAEKFKSKLRDMQTKAFELQHVSGFGDLDSAKALQKKFSLKAHGGDDSAHKRLGQTIEILETMQQTYKLASRSLTQTDQSIATRLGKNRPS